MLTHGLAVEVEFVGDRRHTPPLLLQIAYVHEILQVEHWAPCSGPTFSHLGIFRPALLGNFQPALLGNFRPALTIGIVSPAQSTNSFSPALCSWRSTTSCLRR